MGIEDIMALLGQQGGPNRVTTSPNSVAGPGQGRGGGAGDDLDILAKVNPMAYLRVFANNLRQQAGTPMPAGGLGHLILPTSDITGPLRMPGGPGGNSGGVAGRAPKVDPLTGRDPRIESALKERSAYQQSQLDRKRQISWAEADREMERQRFAMEQAMEQQRYDQKSQAMQILKALLQRYQ